MKRCVLAIAMKGVVAENESMKYEANPKHKEPWQPGRTGSPCPKETHDKAESLLKDDSVLVGNKRYAVLQGKPYCAQEHRSGVWHGYPVDWEDVPPSVKNDWIKARKIKKSQAKKSRSRGKK